MFEKIADNLFLDLSQVDYISAHEDAVYISLKSGNTLTLNLSYKDAIFARLAAMDDLLHDAGYTSRY